MPGKAQVKYIQSLSHKKFRNEEKLFIAEGPKLAEELIAAKPNLIQHLYAVQEWIDANKNLVKKMNEEAVTEITASELQRISQLSTANQVLLLVKQFEPVKLPDCTKELVLMLDAIQDPGNLGTIIRIADWFGIKHIICSDDCADVYNTKVVQSTMGSITRINVHYLQLLSFLQKQKGVKIMAAVLEGIPVQKLSAESSGILIVGNESKGISSEILSKANKKITIPKLGHAESLNAAVATGIILSHLTLK